MEKEFLEFVASVLNVDASALTMESSYKNGDWDSLMQLCLFDEICAKYNIEIPIDEFVKITTLADFYKFIG